ncbi:hypothetical protein LOC68_26875 [Blastopirellula sp. JC732]|uniref:Uncharacterized protein n=1 Tax=Blastopirellula sediminis TaxID=2894196 RepID=A0A9X1MRH5_9BACT|nr:hypothetical protein [Blastopirellula sediminis]MCC9604669.1 hypothetical protein [Blastopirellula sediminis]MCC9632033.1 hypothetical protein [Blastopirellula sediminis]
MVMDEPSNPERRPLTPSSVKLIQCPECGAENQAFAANCWICQRPLAEEEMIEAKLAPAPPKYVDTTSSIFAYLLLVLSSLAIILMGVGVYYVNPVWALYYVLLFGVPLMAAGVGIFYALLSNDENIRKAGAIFASFYAIGMTILGSLGIVFLTIAAIVIFVISVCAGFAELCFGPQNTGN